MTSNVDKKSTSKPLSNIYLNTKHVNCVNSLTELM